VGVAIDAKEQPVTFVVPARPEAGEGSDAPAELSGAAVALKITVKEAREKVVPNLDDEFAKDTGEADTLGELKDKLRAKLLTEDGSISVLVLASASSNEGPGPLVTAFAGKLGNQLRVPLTIVPGALTEAEIDAIS